MSLHIGSKFVGGRIAPGVIIPEDCAANFNLAPMQNGLVITADEPNIAQNMHFGLVPYWAADTKLKISTLNPRSEEALSKKTLKAIN